MKSYSTPGYYRKDLSLKNLVLLTTLFLLGMNFGQAAILHVPCEYEEISQALDAVSNSDTVLVSPGDYTLSDTISCTSIVLASMYILTSDTADIVGTRISNEGNSQVLQADLDENDSLRICGLSFTGNDQDSYRVMTINGNNSAFKMDHCIVRDFECTQRKSVFVSNAWSEISCSRFMNNTALVSGGALGVDNSTLWLHHCIFDSNSSYYGGALKLEDVILTLECNLFRNNVADYWAGAIDCESDHNPVVITRNLFFENSAMVRATAAYLRGFSTLEMTGNSFSENYAGGFNTGYGALMITNGDTPADIFSNVFKSNSCTRHVGAISLFTDADFHGNLVQSNSALSTSALYLGQANMNYSKVLVRNCLFSNNIPYNPEYEEYAGAVVAGYPNDTLLILDNDFILNGEMAVGIVNYDDNDSAYINAMGNYWGHESGPFQATLNPGGQGDTVNAGINVLPFSPAHMTSFTVPEAFELVYPAFGASNDTLPVRFSWNEAFDPDPVDHVDYKLEISDDWQFLNPREYFFIDNTSFVVQDLEPEQSYYWRVTAYDRTWQARTTMNNLVHITDTGLEPREFSLQSPQDGDWVNPQEQVFRWHTSYDFTTGDCVQYELQIADNNYYRNRECFDAGADTFYAVSGMNWEEGETYYWRVLARDLFEHSIFSSESWSFQVLAVNEMSQTGIPRQWGLASLYPNPFNASLKAVIAIPEYGVLKVEVINLLGQTVAVIMNDEVTPGWQTTNWHSVAPSGVYFLRCSSSTGWDHQQRIVLVR